MSGVNGSKIGGILPTLTLTLPATTRLVGGLRLAKITDLGDGDDAPSEMSSRCAMCGKDMSTRDLKSGGDTCMEHAESEATPDPHQVPRPGGGITAPRKPMTKGLVAVPQGKALGGPGSGPHGGGTSQFQRTMQKPGLLAKVKDAAKQIGHNFVKEYHVPKADARGDRPEDRNGGLSE